MYLKTNPEKLFLFDIETNGLSPDTIWCAVFKNKKTQQVWYFINDGSASIYHDLKKFLEELPKDSVFCGHNILSFDVPVLARLVGHCIPLGRCVDTLVLSYLYNPALEGGHSLESYGYRLKSPKIEHHDWTQFSPEMLHRCTQDVELLEKVYAALTKKMLRIGFSELSCEIEHRTRYIIDEQEAHGFWFDTARARDFLQFLRQRESDLAEPVQKLFPPKLEKVAQYFRRRRKDGSDFASYVRHLAQYPKIEENEDGTYSCYELKPFNLGSPIQRTARLIELGYEPTSLTPKGSPKVDEESLVKFAQESGIEAVAALAEWLVTNGRGNMIETWLNNVKPDSRIHGKVMSCGATTRRMTHSAPNTANIPSPAKAKYGHEARALWGVEPGKGLLEVGADADGLETVGLLHYLRSPVAADILLKPKPHDVHTMNSTALTKALGRPVDREWGAKTSWYAWLYGARHPKLGQIVKGTPSDGAIVEATFFHNVPGLKGLIEDTHDEWKSNDGLIKCVDGGFVRCPSKSASLNYRIQSLGAIVMKLAAIILRFELGPAKGLDFHTVGTIHDEWQFETPHQDAQTLGELAARAITLAAERLEFNYPLRGSFKIGNNWAECH